MADDDWHMFRALAQRKNNKLLHVNQLNHDGVATVHIAAMHRFPMYLQHLIDHTEALEVDWNVPKASSGLTALHIRMKMPENVGLIQAMLQIPTLDVNCVDEHGFTALHIAIHARSEVYVHALLEHPNINPNLRSIDMKYTPIMDACVRESPVGISVLLQHPKIDLNVRDELGQDVLMIALVHDLPSHYISEIIAHPGYEMDIYKSDNDGVSVLEFAVTTHDQSALHILLSGNFEIKFDKWQIVLLLATAHNDLDKLQMLLATLSTAYDKVMLSREVGSSLLLESIYSVSILITEYLLIQFPEMDVNDVTMGTTPLIAAITMRQSGIALLLLERKDILVNLQETSSHKTALFFAVQEKQHEVLKRLLSCGDIDIELPNNAGITPLRLAIDQNDELAQDMFKKYFVLKYHHSIAQLAFPEPMLLQMGQDMVRRSISSFETLSEAKQKEYSGWITKREHEVMLTRLGIPIRQRERLPPLRRSERLAAKRLKTAPKALNNY